jgi:hypothetical protein
MLIRIDLRSVPENDRTVVWKTLLEQYSHALQMHFPAVEGYSFDDSAKPTTWRVTWGSFWGLLIHIRPKNWKLERLDISISGFFPIVGVPSTPTELVEKSFRSVNGLMDLTFRFLFGSIHRLALRGLRPNVRSAYGQLESVWSAIQDSHPGLKLPNASRIE